LYLLVIKQYILCRAAELKTKAAAGVLQGAGSRVQIKI